MSENGNSPPVGRRIKAAMQLAGIPSFEELAARIGQRNYGARTLRKYADDRDTENVARRPQLVAIAEACALPVEFFTVDFSELGREPHDLARRVEALEEEHHRLLAGLAEEVNALAAERLGRGELPTAEPEPATASAPEARRAP